MGSSMPPLSLRLTEVDYILKGEVSIQHVLNMAKKHGLQVLKGVSLLTITNKGFNMLKDGYNQRTEDTFSR